jgi:hypothetical protein
MNPIEFLLLFGVARIQREERTDVAFLSEPFSNLFNSHL